MGRKFLIGVVCAVAVTASLAASAYAGNATTLTDPVTKDTLILLTHDKGTYVKHANGLAGYIVVRPGDSAPPKDISAQHEYYVRVYEMRGYVKIK
jgi:hypothetical protein